jgi:hypothetical protein
LWAWAAPPSLDLTEKQRRPRHAETATALLEIGDTSWHILTLCGTRGLKHWRKINGFGNNYFGWGGEALVVKFDKGACGKMWKKSMSSRVSHCFTEFQNTNFTKVKKHTH